MILCLVIHIIFLDLDDIGNIMFDLDSEGYIVIMW